MKTTKAEVLAILETYEGLIAQGDREALARWTELKLVLAKMGGC